MPDQRPYFGVFRQIEAACRGLYTKPRALALILAACLGFGLVTNGSWTATPDAALYVSLGESLAGGTGYVFNGEHHTFVPPGYPVIVAGTARILGADFLSHRIAMVLLGLLTALSGYLLIRRLAGRDAALLIGGVFSLNHVLLHNSTQTLADVPFALFIILALHAVISAAGEKNRFTWAVAAGLLLGVVPLIRINGLGVPPAAAIFLFCAWRDTGIVRRLLGVSVVMICAYAPTAAWQLWKASFPVSYGEGTYLAMVTGREPLYQLMLILTALWNYVPETSYALTGVFIRTGFLELVVPALTVAGFVIAARSGERLLVPLAAIQYVGLLLSPAGSRYLIFLLPGLYLFLALGVRRVIALIRSMTGKSLPERKVLVACFAVMALCNVGHNVKTIFDARSALEFNGPESERSLPFFEAARWLRAYAPSAVVLSTHPRIIHYLSGCRTIGLARSGVPDQDAYVEDRKLVVGLIKAKRPDYLFADSKNQTLYREALAAFSQLGLELEEVLPRTPDRRYHLFKVIGWGRGIGG